MLNHPTPDQLHQLGLIGMARAFAELEADTEAAPLAWATSSESARSRSNYRSGAGRLVRPNSRRA